MRFNETIMIIFEAIKTLTNYIWFNAYIQWEVYSFVIWLSLNVLNMLNLEIKKKLITLFKEFPKLWLITQYQSGHSEYIDHNIKHNEEKEHVLEAEYNYHYSYSYSLEKCGAMNQCSGVRKHYN